MLLLKLSLLESVILSYIKDIQKCNTKVSPIKGHNIKGKKITHKAGQTKAPESLDTWVLLLTASPITQALHLTPQ